MVEQPVRVLHSIACPESVPILKDIWKSIQYSSWDIRFSPGAMPSVIIWKIGPNLFSTGPQGYLWDIMGLCPISRPLPVVGSSQYRNDFA